MEVLSMPLVLMSSDFTKTQQNIQEHFLRYSRHIETNRKAPSSAPLSPLFVLDGTRRWLLDIFAEIFILRIRLLDERKLLFPVQYY